MKGTIQKWWGKPYGQTCAGSDWCGMTVSYVAKKAGSIMVHRWVAGVSNKNRWAYVPTLAEHIKARKYGLRMIPKSKARPGDFILFGQSYYHVGIVQNPKKHGTVEGNNPSSSSKVNYHYRGGTGSHQDMWAKATLFGRLTK